MTLRAIDYTEPQIFGAPEPHRTVLLKLYAQSFDILLLRRQLAAVMGGEGESSSNARMAAMIARSIAGRLAEACELFRTPRSPIFPAFAAALARRGAGEFRRYFDGAEAVVHRLRVKADGRDVAEAVGETLFAIDLYFVVVQEIFAVALTPPDAAEPIRIAEPAAA